MNQAVANRLLRMDRTIEAVDGKLDEVLRLLRPIATPVGVIRTPGSAVAVEHVVEVLGDADLKAFGVDEKVTAVLAEFGHERGDGRLVDAVRAALHAERRARDAANIEGGRARRKLAAARDAAVRPETDDTAAMWESRARFLARMWPGGPVEIRGAGDVLVLPGVLGRRRWWGRRRR